MQTLQASDASLRDLRFLTGLGERAHHVAAAQAAGADVHVANGTADGHADTLGVRQPNAIALAVGVADVVAAHSALLANLTNLTHGSHLLLVRKQS